jgi:hypothetical protein
MGTRSRIGVMHGDNCKSVYCHWDGYLDFNGRMLLEHYDSSKANHLVALGDLSSLRPDVFVAEGVEHSFEKPAEDICIFYGRDRGESNVEFQTDDTFEKFYERADGCGAEYYYIMKDGEWYVGTTYSSDAKLGGKLVLLAEALAEQDIDANEETERALVVGK